MTISDTLAGKRQGSGFEHSRLLHTMLRVRDLEKSLDFYTRLLGMKLLRRKDYPSGEFTLAFVGYGEEEASTVIELTYNWPRKEPYALGEAFGHLAIAVRDIHGACERLAREGVKISAPAGADEAWQHRHRVRRGSRRLQDRVDRAGLSGRRPPCVRRAPRPERNGAAGRPCRAAAAGRSSARDPRSSRSTARPSPWCARLRRAR